MCQLDQHRLLGLQAHFELPHGFLQLANLSIQVVLTLLQRTDIS